MKHSANVVQIASPAVIAVGNALMNDNSSTACDWHERDHDHIRKTMIQCINQLILQRRPHANQDWVDALPEVSRKVEKMLYESAKSVEE